MFRAVSRALSSESSRHQPYAISRSLFSVCCTLLPHLEESSVAEQDSRAGLTRFLAR